ncbi:MAG: Ig-like domain-containing protein, partial [Lachnospiraceae bacterium]|nr:Ig-like domain-containing protein [Lachnospiraceae bacterium]
MRLKKRILALLMVLAMVVTTSSLFELTANAASYGLVLTVIRVDYAMNNTEFSGQYKYKDIAADISSNCRVASEGAYINAAPTIYACPVGVSGFENSVPVSNTEEYLNPNRQTWVRFDLRAKSTATYYYDFTLYSPNPYPTTFYVNGEVVGDVILTGYNRRDKTMEAYVPIHLNVDGGGSESGISCWEITNTQSHIATGSSLQLNLNVASYGSISQAATWTVSGATSNNTTVSSNGFLNVAADETADYITVTATSVANSTYSDSITLAVDQPVLTIDSVTVTPGNSAHPSVSRGNTLQFSANVTGNANPSVSWSVSRNTDSKTKISSNGLLTVGSSETSNTIQVTATSQFDSSKKDTVSVTVSNPVVPTVTSVVVSPSNVTLAPGNGRKFSAQVVGTGNPSQAVAWTVSHANSNSTYIDSNGYLVIGSNESASYIVVNATSVYDIGKSGSVRVNISYPEYISSVTVTPSEDSILVGNYLQFNATVTGNSSDCGVIWTIRGNTDSDTSISSSGLLYVGEDEEAGQIYVTATSHKDQTKSGTAIAYVEQYPAEIPYIESVTISPTYESVNVGKNLQFHADVVGTATHNVTWTVEGNNNGNTYITGDGLLSVSGAETSHSLIVRATSQYDPSMSDSTVVYVNALEQMQSVTILQRNLVVTPGSTFQFTTEIVGGSTADLAWGVYESYDPNTYITDDGLLYVGNNETSECLIVCAVSTYNLEVSDIVEVYVGQSQSIESVSISAAEDTVHPGDILQFWADVTGTADDSIFWNVSGNTDNNTYITDSGLLFVGGNEREGTLCVTATSVYDMTKSDSAYISVEIPQIIQSVTVTPHNASVVKGESQQFTAGVIGNASHNVRWSISGNRSSSTKITANGLLTIGANESASIIYVTATSSFDSTKNDTVAVNVEVPLVIDSVTVTPKNQTVVSGNTLQLSAAVTGNASHNVQWSISGNHSSNTKVSANGLLTVAADEPAGTITVTATSA